MVCFLFVITAPVSPYTGAILPKCELTCSVPQVSIIGPLLFLIYINDTHHAVSKSRIYHFADDTNLLYTCKTLNFAKF